MRSVATTVFALIVTVSANAQQPAPSGAQGGSRASQTPKPAAQPAAPVETATVMRPTEPPGQPVNVRLDLTITDQLAGGEPAKRTMTLIVADRSAGSIRSSGNNVRAVLNVDATPQILPNGTIKVLLGLEYNPRQSAAMKQVAKLPSGETVEVPNEGGTSLNQRVAIVLAPGKPLILSQAADPLSDRKITVEIRAEVLK